MRAWRSWVIPLGAAIVGIVLALSVRRQLVDMETKIAGTDFNSDAQIAINTIQEELHVAGEKLTALRAFYSGSNEVDANEFADFAKRLLFDHTEIRFALWAEESDGRYLVKFTEPPDMVKTGTDLAAIENFRDAIRKAGGEGRLSMAAPAGNEFQVFCRAESKNQKGVVALRISARRLKARAWRRLSFEGIDVNMLDVTDGAPVVLLGEAVRGESDARTTYPYPFAQRVFEIRVPRPPEFARGRRTTAPTAVFWAIVAATIVAVGYIWILQSHAARVEEQVEERTATIRDVTRLQRAILESAEYAIIAFEPDGRILTFNRAAQRMLGYSADDVIGKKSPLDFLSTDELRRRAAELNVVSGREVLLRQAGQGANGPWTFIRSDGETFPVSLSISALRDEASRVTGYLAVAHDITSRLEGEAELRQAKSQAEAASRTKSQFLANMSHELRTPLTAILGYSEMMEEDAKAAGADQSIADLRRIQQAGHHLLRLIDDVLDLSKVEAGRIVLHPERLDLPRLLEEVATTVRPLAEKKGNTLAVVCARGSVEADPTRLKQVLFNLVANAARFTEDGRIVLEAECEPDAVVFRVRDTGIGMTCAELARVFEPFVQADETTTRRFGGTGLGLAIAREFTELMGGSLEADSEPGEGSVFRVRVPTRPR